MKSKPVWNMPLWALCPSPTEKIGVNDDPAFEQYHEYLKRRSLAGYVYRRFVLYPRLASRLTGRVLDIGCGIGDMLGFRPGTVGVDINPLNVAACVAAGYEAVRMEPDRLPFGDDSFQGAVLDNVLEHIAEPHPLLAEVHRVLVPGGTLICGVPGSKGYASDPDHKVFYDEAKLVELLGQAGFAKRDVFYAPLRWRRLDTIMRQYCLYGVFQAGKAN
jgi:SAM-dependent methyltransferase